MLDTVRKELGWGKPLPAAAARRCDNRRHIAGGKTSFIVTAVKTQHRRRHGVAEPGVGTLTVIQRVLAAELGVDAKRITVERGATSDVPWIRHRRSKGTLLLAVQRSMLRANSAPRSRCRIPGR